MRVSFRHSLHVTPLLLMLMCLRCQGLTEDQLALPSPLTLLRAPSRWSPGAAGGHLAVLQAKLHKHGGGQTAGRGPRGTAAPSSRAGQTTWAVWREIVMRCKVPPDAYVGPPRDQKGRVDEGVGDALTAETLVRLSCTCLSKVYVCEGLMIVAEACIGLTQFVLCCVLSAHVCVRCSCRQLVLCPLVGSGK